MLDPISSKIFHLAIVHVMYSGSFLLSRTLQKLNELNTHVPHPLKKAQLHKAATPYPPHPQQSNTSNWPETGFCRPPRPFRLSTTPDLHSSVTDQGLRERPCRDPDKSR